MENGLIKMLQNVAVASLLGLTGCGTTPDGKNLFQSAWSQLKETHWDEEDQQRAFQAIYGANSRIQYNQGNYRQGAAYEALGTLSGAAANHQERTEELQNIKVTIHKEQ